MATILRNLVRFPETKYDIVGKRYTYGRLSKLLFMWIDILFAFFSGGGGVRFRKFVYNCAVLQNSARITTKYHILSSWREVDQMIIDTYNEGVWQDSRENEYLLMVDLS